MPTTAVRPPGGSGPDPGSDDARAWGWVAHLEGGGTQSWPTWRDRVGGDGADGAATRAWLPGAQQLELLRLLNTAGRPDAVLVRRVLTASATGRGRHDVALVGAGSPGRFGPEPTDTADLGDDDLLRVAVGLLAADLADSSAVSPGICSARTRTNGVANRVANRVPNRAVRRLRTRYRLVGDPELADPRRAALVADGRPPGGRGAAVLVLGADLATMLGHAWTTAAFTEGGPAWLDHLERWRQRGGVPRRIDLPAIADRWRADPQVGRLDVVLDLVAVPRLLRLSGRAARSTRVGLAERQGPSASAVEVARRTALALGLLVPAGDVGPLLDARLRPRLASLAASGSEPSVPPEHRGWVDERALAMRDRLVRAGHPFVGPPDLLLTQWDRYDAARETAGPSPLDLAVRLLLEPRPRTPPSTPTDTGRTS